MERDFQRDYRLDWPETVTAAKRRRREMKLTQRRLAVVAGVSLPTVVKFEAGEDVRLSSALAILKVLDMVAVMVEGTLRIVAGGHGGTEPFQAMFSPYAGGEGALEARSLPDLSALEEFLDTLHIDMEEQQKAKAALARGNTASILHVQISLKELHRHWPVQFPEATNSMNYFPV
ncbi:MAG: helix-turn-helix domain-containing protein [Terracidiphilus sp.]